MISGIAASYLIIQPQKYLAVIGAFLLFYKNVLDKVDGSLARARGLDSRRGRFYDSISDFIVTLTSFTAISISLYFQYHSVLYIVAGYLAMLCSMLQCSYFIFYQVSFIRLTGKETVNRLVEDITENDILYQDKWTTFLQRIFLVIYGWQDKLFYAIDKFLFSRFSSFSVNLGSQQNTGTAKQMSQFKLVWYGNKKFLTAASSLSIGTHIFLICISAIAGRFDYYIFVNLICMNLLLILSVIFHYYSSKKQLIKEN
jgi:phosphatidylglycerophosphate synthase